MLFHPTACEEIAAHASRLNSARERSGNLWRDEWDDHANAIQNAYAEAVSRDTPEEWQRVCELARELRTKMKEADGYETIYFTELVFLTDLIEKSLLRARANPQNLIARSELDEVKEKTLRTRDEIHAEYERTPFWQPGKRRRLEAGEEMVKQTVININILSDLKFNISEIKIDFTGAAKKASESVVDKASKIVGLVKDIVKLLNDETFTKSIKQAAEEVWLATQRFSSATIRRFRALKLPEPRLGIDDLDDGGDGPIDHARLRPIPVLVRPPDGEKIRWIVPGGGEVFWDIDGGPEMVVVPAGKFMMGSPDDEPERDQDEGPRREVTFARPFAVGRHAVTRGQFAAFVEATGHEAAGPWREPGFGQDNSHPVVCIRWDDAKAYAAWLAKMTGRPYRLPTEAEWEYVARADTATPFWWGSSITTEQANYDGSYVYGGGGSKGEYRKGTVPVGSFDPNPWGLYNVHGNVWEWCEDPWNDDSYEGAPTDGSAWISRWAQSGRVIRGGSWGSRPRDLRAAVRDTDTEVNRIGFRVARTLTS